jgi:arylsulfatase A-like enzyme
MAGKYLNGYNKEAGVPRGWDHWNVATSDGFGYYGYEMYNDGDPRFYGPHTASGNAYSTDVVRNSTVGLIHDWSGTDRPFFIWSSYYAPHGVCGDNESCSHPPVPAHRYASDYSGVRSPSRSKPSFNEADVSDKPRVIRHLRKIRPHAAQHLFTQRIRALEAVDEGVAATMRALKETGELDNTVVLFTSDNGYLVGEHRYKGKVLPYREALRVPLLVSGPGVPHHRVRRQPVTTVDLAPTILDLTGSRPGRVQDGRSIWPFVRSGSHHRNDDTILIQAGGQPRARKVTPWMYRGVWTGRYTFVKWVAHHELELYDHSKDPYELRNVAHKRAYAPVVRALKKRVAALKDCHGASCRRVFGRVPHPRHG